MDITIYTIPHCPNCETTKNFFKKSDVPFKVVDIFSDPKAADLVKDLGYSSAPVVVAGDVHWGGLDLVRVRQAISDYKKDK